MTTDSGGRVAKFYHFTCSDHGFPGILEKQALLPRRHPLFPHLGPLVWLTDLSMPTSSEQLGLTSRYLKCDRRRWRFEVRLKSAVPWTQLRNRVDPRIVGDLELLGEPEHWFVLRRPTFGSELVRPPVDMALLGRTQ